MKINLTHLARLTGKRKDVIKQRLADAGVEPEKSGRELLYDSKLALPAIYLHQAEAEHQDRIDLGRERALLARAQREKLELEMAERAGSLLPVEVVREIGVGLVTATRAKLLSVHHRIKQRFPHLEVSIVEEIKRLHNEALQELADGDIPEEALERIRQAECQSY